MQTIKNLENDKNETTMLDTFEKTKWLKHVKELFATCHEMLGQKLFLYKKLDGISLWRINYQLNRLADRGIPKDALKKGKIIISLPKKVSEEVISDEQKVLIERTIDQLEGFENLRLSQFYQYKPIYVEKKIFNDVSRWIEIQVSEL